MFLKSRDVFLILAAVAIGALFLFIALAGIAAIFDGKF